MLVISEELCSSLCTHLQRGMVERTCVFTHPLGTGCSAHGYGWAAGASQEQERRKPRGACGSTGRGKQAGHRPSPGDKINGTSELVKRRLLTGIQWERPLLQLEKLFLEW